jgi:N-acetylglutamate synthase-like GNAT family acetyltransferase
MVASAAMNYRLVVETHHEVGLDSPLDESDFVQSYTAQIVGFDDDGQNEVVAGTAGFHVVKLGLAANEGLNAFDGADTVDQELHELSAAVLDEDGDGVREAVATQFEYMGGDLMVIHSIDIEPAHRGHNLALVVADRLIDLYASGIVICRPQGEDAASTTKLQRYFARIGFEPVEGSSGVLGLGTSTERTKVSLLRAGDN